MKMKRFYGIMTVLAQAVLLALPVAGQYRDGKAYVDLNDSETVSALKKQVRIFASDAFEGRKAGSPGEEAAADYLTQAFKDCDIDLLSGEHGDVRIAYRIANAVRDRLMQAAKAAGITDANVLRVAGMVSPQLSFYFMSGDIGQPGNVDLPTPEMTFDVTRSMLENVGRLLAKRRGGTDYFHYDLLCAYVKLDAASTESYREISVSQLLSTAGMSRTEFYKYYKNIDDFFEAFENACVYCALYWLMPYFASRTWPDEQALQIFLSKKETRISINKFFMHGRISDYYPKILSLVIQYLGSFIPGGFTEMTMMSFSFYLSEFAYAICSYLTGLTDYAALKQTFDHLQSVRERYGI